MRIPAEWEPQRAIWVGWPSDPALWGRDLAAAQGEVAGLIRQLRRTTDNHGRKLPAPAAVRVLTDTRQPQAAEAAQVALEVDPGVTFHATRMGDVWLRDTGPVFGLGPSGALQALRFRFNGWGGKDFGDAYRAADDAGVAAFVAEAEGAALMESPLVLEGGALEVDGAGTVLTTDVCLQNPNRAPTPPDLDRAAALAQATGCPHVLRLRHGLADDHTDGHIDNAARFVAPGHVVTMQPSGPDDPQDAALRAIQRELAAQLDASGQPLQISTIPSPGLVTDDSGKPLPASYLNYVISNGRIVVPTYGTPTDGSALAGLQTLFPHHRVSGSPARTLLTGGGAFHCITQHVPVG